MTDQESPEQKFPVGQVGAIYTIGRPIARGVLRGIFDKKDVIVKRVDLFDKCDDHELEHLRSFSHENVVQYLYNDSDSHFQYIVLEKCDCTLAEFVNDSQKKTEFRHLDVLWQITKGMIYLHEEKDIIHRDLKPSNVLMLFRDGRWVVKITDFGISKTLPPDRSRMTQSVIKGTEGYMAPEQMKGFKIGKYTDMYSLGLVFHYVLSEGKHPFGEHTLEAEHNMRDENATPDLNSVKDEYKHDAETLILTMIAYKEEDRVCIKEVQAHHLFWSSKKKLIFYEEVSDFIISPPKTFDEMQPIFDAKLKVIADDWRQTIRDVSSIIGAVFDGMRPKNNKQGDGICDLLRNIRNLRHHYGEKEAHFQGFEEEIGSMPDGYYQFFKDLFPGLLNHVYEIMKRFKEKERFVDYYTYKEQEHLRRKLSSGDAMQSETSTSSANGVLRDIPGQSEEGIPAKIPRTGLTGGFQTMAVLNEKTSPKDAGITASSVVIQRPTVATELGNNPSSDFPIDNGNTNMSVPRTTTPSTGPEQNAEQADKQEEKLVLRDYQWELAQEALKGENSLIVAPTGSGKTAVLTEVIKKHLESHRDRGCGRVMFIVPKTALALQQYWYLKRHLTGSSIDYMIGQFAESAPVGQRILDHQVTVLTPQILINELGKDPDKRYLSFGDLTMFIFDECHNATKSHPYRELMDMLLDFETTKPEKRIQVVGVTASPGVGKAKEKAKVEEKLIELLGNLNVLAAPMTVEKNLEELARHQSKIKEYFLQIEAGRKFSAEVEIVIGELENIVSNLLKENQIESANLGNAPLDKSSQPYGKWIADFKEIVRTGTVQDGELVRLFLSYANNLKLYHYLLQLKDLVPNAIGQARRKVPISTEGPERTELEKKYESLREKAIGIQTPMFVSLLNILKREFDHNPDARCMIFVEWKLTAECLNDCISKSELLETVKSDYMIGANTSGGISGMSKTKHEDIVKAFQRGDFKILIATSVAEEGLDFVKCSLVIMYNYVTGEVGRLQRHGRGRTDTCKAIILATAQGDHKKREEDNKKRAAATKIAIEDIKKRNPNILRDQILEAQQKHKNERLRKRRAVAGVGAQGESPAKWQILCGACHNLLTTGDKLRDIDKMHTVVKDREFFSRTVKRKVQIDKAPNVKGLADYHCIRRTCGEKVALGMDYDNKLHPALSIKRIVVRNDKGTIRNPKKRKNLPFNIDKSLDEYEDGEEDVFETIDRTQAPEQSTEASLNLEDCYEFLNLMESN